MTPADHTSAPRRPDIALYALAALAAAGLLAAPWVILRAPTEPVMGFVQRIFYFHVPAAMVTFLSAFVCAGGSAAYLFRGSRRGDQIAVAAAELTVVFGLCVLVTGPLWGRKAWGVWWVWKDVRLMTTVLLWFMFVAYLFVRRYAGPGAERLSAGLALFAAADVPIVYTSVFFWRTQHPKATVLGGGTDPTMRPALYLSMVTMFVLYGILLWVRLRLERVRGELEELHLAATDAGLLDDE